MRKTALAGIALIAIGSGIAVAENTAQTEFREAETIESPIEGGQLKMNARGNRTMLEVRYTVGAPTEVGLYKRAEFGMRRYETEETGECEREEYFEFNAAHMDSRGDTKLYTDLECDGRIDSMSAIRNICPGACQAVPLSDNIDVYSGEETESIYRSGDGDAALEVDADFSDKRRIVSMEERINEWHAWKNGERSQTQYMQANTLAVADDGIKERRTIMSDAGNLAVSIAIVMPESGSDIVSKMVELGWRRHRNADGSCAGEESYIFDSFFADHTGETRIYLDRNCDGVPESGMVVSNICQGSCRGVPFDSGMDVISGEVMEARDYAGWEETETQLRSCGEILVDMLEDPSNHMHLEDEANKVFSSIRQCVEAERKISDWSERGY